MAVKTKVEDMREGVRLTFSQYKTIDAETLTEWVRKHHPETREEYLSLLKDKHNVFDKFQEIEQRPENKEATERTLTFFEVREWVCKKYKMYPEKKVREKSAGRKKIIDAISRENWETAPASNNQSAEE